MNNAKPDTAEIAAKATWDAYGNSSMRHPEESDLSGGETDSQDAKGEKKFEMCARGMGQLPCICDIYILAGLMPSCRACESRLDEFRALHDFRKVGEFYRSDRMTDSQRSDIDAQIAKAQVNHEG